MVNENDERGPVKRYILGEVVAQPEDGCYTFSLQRQQVFFKPELVCKNVFELPQDKAQGEIEAMGKRIAQVVFLDPKNITPLAGFRFFSWLI